MIDVSVGEHFGLRDHKSIRFQVAMDKEKSGPQEEVLGILNCITVDKFPGLDGIYPRLLREAREEIAGALADIFISSLTTGKVPEDWRLASVVPLFEEGSRDNPGNYKLGSVFGPLLFVVCINDLEGNVAGLISKFADDTKIGGVAGSGDDREKIQQDIDGLATWAQKWQMEFNPDKCE
eukprot:g40342.t1